jgi:glutamyl-tRNA reductase
MLPQDEARRTPRASRRRQVGSAALPILVGLDHRSAPLELRERIFVEGVDLVALLLALHQEPLAEVVILSTCNRFEVYASGADPERAPNVIVERLATLRATPPDQLTGALYTKTGADAARHLLRVAAGLESLIVGESQIQGQVAVALRTARTTRTAGLSLSRLFSSALHTGKRARSETGISRQTLSVSHAAARLVERELGALAGRRVAIIGSGAMAALAMQAIRTQGATDLCVVSRTYEKAYALAQRHHAQAFPWALKEQALRDADAVVVATRAPHLLLHADDFSPGGALAPGSGSDAPRPVVIDISVPRAVDPAVRDLSGLRLYDIDDLQVIVANHQDLRRSDVERVEQIVDEELASHRAWMQSRRVVPVITALRQQAETVAHEELERALRRAPDLDDREREVMAEMAHRIVAKLLHAPTITLKARAARGEHVDYVHATRKLFALDEPDSAHENGSDDE